MIDLNKKYWREKVTAEITLAHMLQFAGELGANMSPAEAAAFLNEKGRAQDVWMHMMQAGEEYIKSSLESKTGIHNLKRPMPHVISKHPLQQRVLGTAEPPSVLYQ